MGITLTVKQIHTTESLVIQPASFDEFLRKSSQGMHCQILTKFWQITIQAEDKAFHSDVHNIITLILFGMRNKNAIVTEGIYYCTYL
jgi:hypothetical protein